jgi:CubicO group peptidase (beta-lactamase class C family)/D-alanyl-D-alanine dipeptidase
MTLISVLLGFTISIHLSDTMPAPIPVVYDANGVKVMAGYKPEIFADSNRAEKIKTLFPVIHAMYAAYAAANRIPGIAFGIISGGKLMYADAIGTGNIARNIPVSPRSVYRIASMTKSFAAMAILKLRDAGKLSLEDPISKFIPEFDSVAALTSDAPPPTIHNLLTHTAGFPEDNPWGDRQLERRDEELIAFLKKGVSLSNTPGSDFEYANLGFAIIGAIITKASGEHYEKYIRENIFDPLGMKHTFWEYVEVPDSLLVQGYRVVNDNWVRQPMLHRGAYGIMGGLMTSIEDFSKYINLHLSAWPPRSGADTFVIRRSSIREMHLPGKVSGLNANARNGAGDPCPSISSYNFGLGWAKDCTGKQRIGHSGGLPGFGSNWAILPAYDLGIVSFCNLTYSASVRLNERILDTIVALASLKPRILPASNILEDRKNRLLRLLPDWKNAAQSGIFAENFFLDYFTDSLKKDCRALFAKAGKITKVGEMIPTNQLRGSSIIEGTNTNLELWFTLSPENPAKIQAFELAELTKQQTSFNRYKLKTISTVDGYRSMVKKNPDQALVSLDKFIPGIKLDIRYATSDNIMKEPVYDTAAAYLRKPAAEALKKVQATLNKLGYGLKIFDGYRPYDVTTRFYEAFHDTNFVASPYTGSRHNRGCAVDLTIIDLNTGKELAMPTPYDAFSEKSYAGYPGLSKKVLKNRELFQKVMTENGFDIYPYEWWHYDFKDWRNYPLMDIPFKSLPPVSGE